MQKNENIMVYPYSSEFSPVLRHKHLLRGMTIVELVSPNGWGLTGCDASRADMGQYIGITVHSDFKKGLNASETVFFCDFNKEFIDRDKVIYGNILEAASQNRNIICTVHLDEEIRAAVSGTCAQNGKYFKYLPDNFSGEYKKPDEMHALRSISAPVIFIGGVCESSNKFQVQLSLGEAFKEAGYKVGQIGTRHYCELLGFHSFPGFMFSNQFNEKQKILMFNKFVKEIEMTEKPDLIMIGIPGGMGPLDQDILNDFGVTAYEISNAVKPDAMVMNVFHEGIENDTLTSMSQMLDKRLGFEADCFCISNRFIDWVSSKRMRKAITVMTDLDFVSKSLEQNFDIPAFNALCENDITEMCKYIVDKLGGCDEEIGEQEG